MADTESARDEIWRRADEVRLLVAKMVRRDIKHGVHEMDDLIQAGTLGVLERADRWDRERGSLATFVHHVAKTWLINKVFIVDTYDYEKANVLPLRLDAPVPRAKGNQSETPMGELIPAQQNVEHDVLRRCEYEWALRYIDQMSDERMKDVLRSRFQDEPEGLEYIGARLGICKERVRQIETMGLRRLRKMMKV